MKGAVAVVALSLLREKQKCIIITPAARKPTFGGRRNRKKGVQTHMGKRGGIEGGGFPPSEVQKPTPYPKAENWLPSKKKFFLPPL